MNSNSPRASSKGIILILAFMLINLYGCRQLEIKKTGTADVSLYKKYESYFSVGAAVAPKHLSSVADILEFHFNRLAAENDMKFGPIHPAAGRYSFSNADAIANFARNNSMTMTGHTFVWHRQQPSWLFSGLSPGNTRDIETLKNQLKNHIETLVNRYDDVVDNWDVVNEAISDTGGKTYRDGSEGSEWYRIFQSEEYIYWAFKYSQDALAAKGSNAKLYYNDYNVTVPSKLNKILSMVQWLRSRGLRIDGIGLQGHWKLDWPTLSDIRSAINKISTAGLEVKISELDISIYTNDDWSTHAWEAEKAFTEQLETQQAVRYRELFMLFKANSGRITSVTFWGVSDDATWLDYHPKRRNDYPLLFDDRHKPKLAYYAITDF
ncbi:MAG: endo-1,4-beta-xylanase [Spirochaetales bacterium]|nr:endo-1,4-beta-xylanase [Spirochaetales bacterium]